MRKDAYDWSKFNMDEFKAEFLERYPDDAVQWPLFEKALTHRNAWKSGYMELWQSPLDMVRDFITLSRPGTCAWVTPDGKIYSFPFAKHDSFASVFLGENVLHIEQKYARISEYTTGVKEATGALQRTTKKMIDAIWKHVNAYEHYAEKNFQDDLVDA